MFDKNVPHDTMLYRVGTTITCGPYSLDYIVVPTDTVAAHVGNGWYETPKAAQDGFDKEVKRKAQEKNDREEAEEAARVALLQKQIETNQEKIDEANQSNGPDYVPGDAEPTNLTQTEASEGFVKPADDSDRAEAQGSKGTDVSAFDGKQDERLQEAQPDESDASKNDESNTGTQRPARRSRSTK